MNLQLKRKTKIAKRYDEGFKKNKNIITPKVNKNINHAYHLYTILINFKKDRQKQE